MQPNIYGIRFSKIGKVYHFDASHLLELKVGEHVIVETTRGRQIGEVVQQVANPVRPPEGNWKPVERRASAADLLLRQSWVQKQTAAMIECRARASELKLAVKIVTAEYSFDGSRLTLMFATENDEKDEKVDLKSLRKDMQKTFSETLVEMRQIGPRDVAKMLGGMGACGLESRCCSQFLTEFSPISIKMAKEQGISLTPSEITGMCGRLRCCLIYEYEQYVAARKELPKRNKRVISPEGEGKVIDVYPLRNAVLVELPAKNPQERSLWKEFHRDLLEPWDELEALRRKSASPCDRHEGGGCDCGKAAAETTTTVVAEARISQEANVVTDSRRSRESDSGTDSRRGQRRDSGVDSRPNRQTNHRPGAQQPENRPAKETQTPANAQPESRPNRKPENRKPGKRDKKPGEQKQNRPPESPQNQKPGNKPENRPNRRKPFRKPDKKGPPKEQQ
jgi:cell fate regulator YaaT (PSP1 superfamily)